MLVQEDTRIVPFAGRNGNPFMNPHVLLGFALTTRRRIQTRRGQKRTLKKK